MAQPTASDSLASVRRQAHLELVGLRPSEYADQRRLVNLVNTDTDAPPLVKQLLARPEEDLFVTQRSAESIATYLHRVMQRNRLAGNSTDAFHRRDYVICAVAESEGFTQARIFANREAFGALSYEDGSWVVGLSSAAPARSAQGRQASLATFAARTPAGLATDPVMNGALLGAAVVKAAEILCEGRESAQAVDPDEAV
jgi:hypothetical protein